MTKLEQKLIELGYKEQDYIHKVFLKDLFPYSIFIQLEDDKIRNYAINSYCFSISIQRDMDKLQRVFNEMQKDLVELRKYESN